MAKATQKAEFNPQLLAAMRAQAPLNLEKAQELADQFDTKVRSVIAKAVRESIPYEKKERVRKDGKPVASKEATVGVIEHALDVEVGYFAGLEKASKQALERVRDALANVCPDEDVEADTE